MANIVMLVVQLAIKGNSSYKVPVIFVLVLPCFILLGRFDTALYTDYALLIMLIL
jgi:hypothetical protein